MGDALPSSGCNLLKITFLLHILESPAAGFDASTSHTSKEAEFPSS
jgi:hypothetical protein